MIKNRTRSTGCTKFVGAGRISTMRFHRHRHLPPTLAAAVILGLLAAACASPVRSPGPSASTHGPTTGPGVSPNASADQAIYAQIEAQVEQLRELPASRAVTPTLLDEKGVRDWMARSFATQTDHAALAAQSRLLVHLGLLPGGASLEKLELDLESSQVVGFYDPETKGLYVLSASGGVGASEKLTFSHEFTHALQDQHFGLDKLAIDAPDQSDRDLARTSLAEGDATLSMTQWAEKSMSLLDLVGLGLGSASADQTAQLAAAPAILRESLMFPYEQGLNFVQAVYADGGWSAVDKLYANPPNSTSQILHPELYTAGVQPVAMTVPAVPASLGSGWKLAMQDTMGELQFRVWLEGEHPAATQHDSAVTAVSSWGGDRVGLYEGPNGAWAVVLSSDWRTAAGRQEFFDAASSRLDALGHASRICGGPNHVDIAIASDQTVLPSLLDCNSMD
jgi:hypothetical protein